MEISKKNLLSFIKENIDEMAMDFDTEDRPSPDIQSKLATGDTPLKKVPLPKTGDEPNKNFQELLASERYKQVIQKVRQYTGINTPLRTMGDLGPLTQMMMSAHNQIIQTERAHRDALEKVGIELVMKEFSIPEGAVEFDAKIVGLGEIDASDFNRENQGQQNAPEVNLEVEEDLANDLQNLDLEKAKRRLINNIIQGASKKGHYMYHYVADKIREITGSENLINQYGVLMSINDTLYWQLGDEQMQMMMGGGGGEPMVGGKESVDRNSDPPKITVRAINFPVLVHELIKGWLELLSHHGDPSDEETFSAVQASEDTLEKEMWDLRLGPAIWDRIRTQFPEDILTDEDKYELQNYLIAEIFKLPARNFLVFAKEVIGGTVKGKRLMNELMDGIEKMLKDEEFEQAVQQFESDLDDISDDTDDDDLRNFLGGLGIDIPSDN